MNPYLPKFIYKERTKSTGEGHSCSKPPIPLRQGKQPRSANTNAPRPQKLIALLNHFPFIIVKYEDNDLGSSKRRNINTFLITSLDLPILVQSQDAEKFKKLLE